MENFIKKTEQIASIAMNIIAILIAFLVIGGILALVYFFLSLV